jgi:hypothetical protein
VAAVRSDLLHGILDRLDTSRAAPRLQLGGLAGFADISSCAIDAHLSTGCAPTKVAARRLRRRTPFCSRVYSTPMPARDFAQGWLILLATRTSNQTIQLTPSRTVLTFYYDYVPSFQFSLADGKHS